MVRSERSHRPCCMVSEMLEEWGVTRKNVYHAKKVVLRAVKALIEAELEHLERIEKRRPRGPAAGEPRGPRAVRLEEFRSKRRRTS